jgi:diguanylate cyclase (GGDEF)-like protein
MKTTTEKNEVFGDYGTFLHALLPNAQAFIFHDRHGGLFWHDKTPDTSQLDDAYHTSLNNVLSSSEPQKEDIQIQLRDCTAYLMRLISDQGRVLGVLTALVDRDVGTMQWQFCSDLLQPALRSLRRELSLRVHLLDVNEKLNQHGGEYDFLKELGDRTRQHNGCYEALHETLELCRKHLILDGAIFLAPERDLSISVGPNPLDMIDADLIYEAMQDIAAEADGNVSEALANRAGPDPRDRSRAWPILEEGKNLVGILVLSRAVDVGKLSEQDTSMVGFVVSTIEYVMERGFDSLTGLINWPGFESSLESACLDVETEYSLMYLDIDQLDVVNDTFGRETGDEILRSFAGILRKELSPHTITRVASDSFAALLGNCTVAEAEVIAKAICTRLRELDYASGAHNYKPSVSVGVASLMPNEKDLRSVLVPAQVACQAAKDRGRGRVEIYQSTDVSIIRRMDEINQLGSIRNAIDAGRLILFAQPIVRLDKQNQGSYYELLVRLLDTSGNPVEPSEFLGAAERFHLVQEIDRWVVAKAIETLATQGETLSGHAMRFAVNLSGQSLGNDQFLDFVRSELAQTAVAPDRICFEITETVAVSNLQKAQLFISEMKKIGCLFSLDDFGTGLSSFAYLKLFDVNKIKIDGSFVHDICQNEVSRSMVSAIAEIAHVMNIETVAEYVQDEETVIALREIGIDWAQGFHIGKPMRLTELFDDQTIIDTADIADVADAATVNTAILTTLPS